MTATPAAGQPSTQDTSYASVVLGDRAGYVALAFGRGQHRNTRGTFDHHDWTPSYYRWPDQAEQLWTDVAREIDVEPTDVYVCPAVRHTRQRRKGDALPPMVCWADLDTEPADHDLVHQLDPYVVDSGQPGHTHLYLPLSEPIDLGTHAALNRALAEQLGGDAKWSDESLLRLPGTHNHKTTPPALVTEPEQWGGTLWTPAGLAALLGVDLDRGNGDSSPPQLASAAQHEAPPEPLPAPVRRALEHPDISDRSVAHARLVGACYDAGLTHGQALSLAADYPPSQAKYGTRLPEEVARWWAKVDAQNRADSETIESPSTVSTGPVTVTLSTVEPERVEWLWPARLPAGKLVLLDGDPSLGKSTLSLDIAAHVTTGNQWPDGTDCPVGDVVLLSAEDGMADTIRPRLDAAGADPSKVHAFTSITERDDEGNLRSRPPTLADGSHLREVVQRTHARLLIIDVLMAYMPGKVDSHRDQDVRGVLHNISTMADETGCTVLLLRHLNKTGGGSALYRGGGSIGIVGAARAGFLVAPDPDDESGKQLVLAAVKSNLAAMPNSLNYRLEDSTGSHVAHVVWGEESTHGAGELLSVVSDEERSDRDDAVSWLTDYLANEGGTASVPEVFKAGGRDGFSKDQLKRAKHRAGARSVKNGMDDGWVWTLEESTKDAKDAGTETPHPSPPSLHPSEGRTVQTLDSSGSSHEGEEHPAGTLPDASDGRPAASCDRCGTAPAQIHHSTGKCLCTDHHPNTHTTTQEETA